MFPYKGYAGKYLVVDLTSGKLEPHEYDPKTAELYLGGNGFGTKLLWESVGVEVDPLSPENLLIFSTGPLCGTGIPNSSRIEVIAKSPLTGIYGDSNSGGHFASELKFAGWDAIVFKGRSKKPVYLMLEDSKVTLFTAEDLWGSPVRDTEEAIRKKHGDRMIKTAIIGPAGENMVRFAGIQFTPQRSAARAGMGAVMGSKNLKALAVRGHGKLNIASPKKYRDLILSFNQRLLNHPIFPAVRRYGTPGILSLMDTLGRYPTRNFQQGAYERIEMIDAEALEKRAFVRNMACFGCPVGCDKFFKIPDGKYAGLEISSVEYENMNAFGGGIANCDLDEILKANDICDHLGMDAISAGRAISFAMELWEQEIINLEDTGGLELKWGNMDVTIKLLEMMAHREGFGDLLADGVRMAAQKIGRGADHYAMHVKGMEIPGQDGRAQRSMGLAHATSSRGADHLKAFPTVDEVANPDDTLRRFGPDYLPEMSQPLETKYKPFLVKDGEDFAAVIDSVGTCKSGGSHVFVEFYWDDIAAALELATGMTMNSDKLKMIGERICNLQRCYNVAHGITRKDDCLPERFYKEPNPSGNAKDQVINLEPMLDEYYDLRGWDVDQGIPNPEKLKSLGLEEAVNRIFLNH